ncbi:hypothetical protein FOL47_003310 [Perkinsus chesapeaki]|uniref:3-deoxy-7-phosphoheptulonate synthase n=1 Tax=Perkinsus chesapeaki TaxID=330153 RepID=A0A7J6MZR8_PERCH|nr:hypothetical protein FOL47_003310 [Perkinsus chesapeaki]
MPVPKVLVGKVIVVGPASVGKTCLVTRFVDDVFDANTQSTLGCDSKEKTLNVTGVAEPVKLILYDTAGQERFAQLAGSYYRQADICLLCFDLSNAASFDQIKWWQNQVAQHNDRAEFVLVGTKQDLAPKLDVSFARRYANENGFPFFLTSSLTGGEQIEFLFHAVAEKVVRIALQRQMLQQQTQHSSFGAPVPTEGTDYGVAVARDYDRPIKGECLHMVSLNLQRAYCAFPSDSPGGRAPSRVEIMSVPSAEEIHESIPSSKKGLETIVKGRREASDIIRGIDDRLLVIVGPCSVHDTEAAREYAKKLKEVSERYRDELVVIMRVYYEKPRSTVGWKGLLNDPFLDDTCQVLEGINVTRELLRDITDMGVPVACEFVEAATTQYFEDLVSWAAVGARTVESQPHRQLASGLDLPIGFKNSTGGDIAVAVDAVICSGEKHTFLAPSSKGGMCVVRSKGNKATHVVLRGGRTGPNYGEEGVTKCLGLLRSAGLDRGVVVDCSHGNSNKDYRRQPLVLDEVCRQMASSSQTSTAITGVMIESNLFEGSQKLPASFNRSPSLASESTDSSSGVITPGTPGSEEESRSELSSNEVTCAAAKLGLKYGVSITDGCVGWETTEHMLYQLSQAVKERRKMPTNVNE